MKKYFSFFLLGFIFLNGCGYRLGSTLPSNIKTISISTFKNLTPEPGVEMSITNEVINQFQIDGTVKVVEDEEADVKLEGEIVGYKREPLRFTGQDFREVSEYRLRLIVRLNLIDVKTNQPLWSDRVVEGETTYFVGGSFRETERTALGALTNQERSQLPTLEEDLSRNVVESVVEAW